MQLNYLFLLSIFLSFFLCLVLDKDTHNDGGLNQLAILICLNKKRQLFITNRYVKIVMLYVSIRMDIFYHLFLYYWKYSFPPIGYKLHSKQQNREEDFFFKNKNLNKKVIL
jgi:hypothetical protein